MTKKEGMLVNSAGTGMEMHKAMSAIMDKAEAEGFWVNAALTTSLRDWLIEPSTLLGVHRFLLSTARIAVKFWFLKTSFPYVCRKM